MSRRMIFGRYDYAAWLSFAVYACCSTVVPIVLPHLAADLGFALEEGNKGLGGALQVGRSTLMVVAMLYCGFAAGRWGKYASMGVSLLMMGAGILIVSSAPWYWVVFAGVALAGLGEGVIEGLATPFVQDQHAKEPSRYVNFAHSFWSVGVLVMGLGSGILLQCGVSWRWIVAGAGAAAVVRAMIMLMPDRRPGGRPGHNERQHFKVVFGQAVEIMKTPVFWIFFAAMFLAGAGEFCLTFWLPSYLKLDYRTNDLLATTALASFAAAMFIGRIGSGYLIRPRHLKHLIVYCALAATLLSACIPFLLYLNDRSLALVLLYALVILTGLATAPFWPSIQSYCTHRMPGLDMTMIFILLSCAGVPGCGFAAWLMGALGDLWSLNTAVFMVPVSFAVMGLLVVSQWRRPTREPDES